MRLRIYLIVLLLVLTSCNNYNQERKFYQGVDGVDIEFASGSPPREVFFSPDQIDEDGIPILVDVRVKNKGASVTRGGIFISGYDPTLIDFEEVDEDRGFFDSCRFSSTSLGSSIDDILSLDFGNFQGFIQCTRLDLGVFGDTSLGIGINDFGITIDIRDLGLGSALDRLFNTEIFTNSMIDTTNVRFDTGDGSTLAVTFDDPAFDPNLGSRGPHFLSLWAAYDFTLNQGQEFLLQGDNPFFPGGQEEFVTFNGRVMEVPYGVDESVQPIMITSCYLYTTYASPVVCIDPDPYSENTKVCGPKTFTERGQGGPVAVTSVTQRSTGREMAFRIEIQNLGRGQVYNPMNIDSCSPYYPSPVTEEDLDIVVLGMVFIGEDMLRCYPEEDYIRLYNDRGVINCVYDLDNQALQSKSGYETPLLIELWYGYSETIKRDVKINRLAR